MPPSQRLRSLDELSAEEAGKILVLASDIDDSITEGGLFPGNLFALFEKIHREGIRLLLVTGRSAGAGATLAAYLPFIEGVIAENGAVYYPSGGNEVSFLSPELCDEAFIATQREVYDKIAQRFPIRPTADAAFRLTETTFIKEAAFTSEDLDLMRALALEVGLELIYSSIHVHILSPKANKAAMVHHVCSEWCEEVKATVATFGDSPNDRPMFSPDNFDISFGAGGVRDYREVLGEDLPAYLCKEEEVRGFQEMVEAILGLRAE